jgi:hypothetical protein
MSIAWHMSIHLAFEKWLYNTIDYMANAADPRQLTYIPY